MEVDKLMLKLIWKKKSPKAASTVSNMNKGGGMGEALLDMKTYYKAIIIKTVWYWLRIGLVSGRGQGRNTSMNR